MLSIKEQIQLINTISRKLGYSLTWCSREYPYENEFEYQVFSNDKRAKTQGEELLFVKDRTGAILDCHQESGRGLEGIELKSSKQGHKRISHIQITWKAHFPVQLEVYQVDILNHKESVYSGFDSNMSHNTTHWVHCLEDLDDEFRSHLAEGNGSWMMEKLKTIV